MEKYYDAFLHLANWGSRQLMLRVPCALVDVEAFKPYCTDDGLSLRVAGENVVLDIRADEDEGDGWEEGEGWLASLVPLRGELLAGDLRPLYLAWLCGIRYADKDDDTPEPPVPPGLGKLSAAQSRLVDFLQIDPDLVEVAGRAGTGEAPAGPSRAEMTAWLAGLPGDEKDALLLQLMEGEGAYLGVQLLRRFQQDRQGKRKSSGESAEAREPRRTVAELLAAAGRLEEEKRRRKKAAAERKAAAEARKRAEERTRHLDAIAPRASELWQEIAPLIETKLPKEYDRAVQILKDLWDLAERSGKREETAARIRALREQHARKRTLLQRLDRVGLPK